MRTGKTTKCVPPGRPFNPADHLQNEAEIAAYIEAMLEDGDARAVPVARRTVAEAVGGMAALAHQTGFPVRRCIGPFLSAGIPGWTRWLPSWRRLGCA
ncbi:MAG: hypothetical protein JWN85_5165 [Gammaproteobacteria bacterium]|nr:hypothetical protein [Gammaproteobacteria bacterium]